MALPVIVVPDGPLVFAGIYLPFNRLFSLHNG